MQAWALRVRVLFDDHTFPSCLVAHPLAKMMYRSVNTLVLPDPWLTQESPVTFPACASHQLFVRSCDLAHHGLYCSHVRVRTHHSSLQHLPFCVRLRCHPVSIWMDISTCGFLLAPQGGITRTARASRTPHHTLSNSHNLVRAPRSLCRNRPPHGSHMMQCLQALCLAHRLHTAPSAHRFRPAPPALSQVTLCQPRSLRLPRSSPLLHFWSVASLSTLPRRPSYQSPHHLWMPLRRLFHTPLPLRTFPRNFRSRSSLSLRCIHPHNPSGALVPPSTHDVLCSTCSRPALRYFLMRLCRRLRTASQLMMPPHNYRSRSSSSGASSPMTLQTAKLCHRHYAILVVPHLPRPR